MVTAEKEKIESLYTDKELLSFLWSYVRTHTKIFNVVIVTLILNTLLSISSPLFFRYVVDVVEQGLTSNAVAKNVKIAIFAYIAFNLISWLLRSIQMTV